jgi:MFS family permease
MTFLISEQSTLKQIFSSLRSKNYRLYFYGQGVSLIGTWIQNIALSWLVYRLTGSVFLLGLIGFTTQIPTFILTPFTGVIIDRHDRLKIMRGAQVLFMIHAFVMAFLVLSGLIEVWHIIVLSIIFGVINAFDAPSRQSLVIDLIDDPANLSNAIALNSAIFNGARLVGPAIAGMVIALVGEGICFLINALSFVFVIIALYNIRVTRRKNERQSNELLCHGSYGNTAYRKSDFRSCCKWNRRTNYNTARWSCYLYRRNNMEVFFSE